MKQFWIIALLALGACGKVELDSSVQLGQAKLTEPEKLGATDLTRIQSMCDALKVKENDLTNIVNTEYGFAGATKGCTDTAYAPIADTIVKLVDQNGYKYIEGVSSYYFSDIETESLENTGIMSQICGGLSLGVSPLQISGEFVFFSVDDSTDCASGNNQQCIVIEKARRSSDTEAKVHTREWIKIKLDQPNRGIWTYKKRISQSSCVDGYFFGRSATLK